jgi:hypothetical protein
MMSAVRHTLAALLSGFAMLAQAQDVVTRTLPYPAATFTQPEDGRAIADQVYFVNHFFALKNFSWEDHGERIAVLINKRPEYKPTTNTVERHFNSDYSDGEVRAMDLAIFRSGKLDGTGILITDYLDPERSQLYTLWLPVMRKTRRFAEPNHNEVWGGSVFTYGDIYLRRPHDETHSLLGTETFKNCLSALVLNEDEHTRWTQTVKDVMDADCSAQGRTVYKVKSVPLREDWWYDERMVYIDTQTFADYRSEYFKNGAPVKTLDKAWYRLDGETDPRAQAWRYWYAKDVETLNEGMAVVPPDVVRWNQEVNPSLWSERTLRRIKR